MILQTDPRMLEEPDIDYYGCHYMGQLFLMVKRAHILLDPQIILKAYKDLRSQPASYQDPTRYAEGTIMVIGPKAEQNNPDDIADYFGVKYKRKCRFEDRDYVCRPDEQELLQFQRPSWYHWVAGDGSGHVAYDSEGESITVAQGHIVRKKIFTFLPYESSPIQVNG